MSIPFILNKIESYSNEVSNEAKEELQTLFNATKDPWLVNGLIDYYIQTNSVSIVDLLIKVHSPHDCFIFEKIHKLMRESPTSKKVALTLFSQIIRKHPTWIHKIVEHQLMKELIKLLKTERDVAIYMLALMCIISLLPIVPATIAKILQDLFEIFNYLAVWISSNTSNLPECQLIQLQYNLCTLFKRLYGMYPCNFIEFIKVEYVFSKDPSKQTVFNQVISPMLENQRCHPLLLQANKQNELTRWKKAEPHDVVMECARYAIESDRNSSLTTSSLDYSSFISMKTVDFFNSTTPLVDLRHIPNAKSIENKFESIWSPSHVITATPSANTVPNTPTPTPLPPTYGIHHGIEGTSPPTEAGVEATPETTPMKPDRRPYASSSTAARAIWPKTSDSQPSSPMKKADFSYPSASTVEQQPHLDGTMNQKLKRLVNDRHQVQIQMPDLSNELMQLKITPSSSPMIGAGPVQDVDFEQKEPEDEIDDEDADITLVNPDIFTRSNFVRRVKRLRMVSHCLGDSSSSYSTGTSPADVSYMANAGKNRLKRFYSWPDLKNAGKIDVEISSSSKNGNANGTSSSPSDEAISASTHFMKQDKKVLKDKKNLYKEIREDLNQKLWDVEKKDCASQTLQMWPQPHDVIFNEIFSDENLQGDQNLKDGGVVDISKITPKNIVDKYMDVSLKKRNSNDLKYDIELLRILLQYERYRREIHAERNRRLLPKSRQIRQMEQSNETLKEQCRRLSNDIETHNRTSADLRRKFQAQLEELNRENQNLKKAWLKESENNQHLKRQLDSVQFRLDEEMSNKKQSLDKIQLLNAEIIDLKNDLDKTRQEAEMGKQYRDELQRLQCELTILSEAKIKVSQKMSELENIKARDGENEMIEQTYLEENRDLQRALDLKTSQGESMRAKLGELESMIQKRDLTLAELKRSEQIVKDQFEERFNALEEKYSIQKSIVVKMEESILELKKNSTVNQTATSPESDRTDLVGSSLELSCSMASSLGDLSSSLRSTHEMRSSELKNLQSLVTQNPNAAGSSSMMTPSSSDFEKNGRNFS